MRYMVPFLIAALLSWTAYIRTEGFSADKLIGLLPSQTVDPITESTLQILSQPFHYLGKGRQSFVFESEDKEYVLKCFNQSYFRMPWYSIFVYEKERLKRAKRRSFFESSYAIAKKEFGEEILYIHLSPTAHLPTHKKIQGPAHGSFSIDLNKVAFVLQKKGSPFYAGLHAIYKQEGMLGLKREINQFKAQIANRIAKHIADSDKDVEHNWGYRDGKIFHLDPGRLYYDPSLVDPERQKAEWYTATHRFHKWLLKHYEEAAIILLQRDG